MAKRPWTGEAAKVRRKTLGAIARRINAGTGGTVEVSHYARALGICTIEATDKITEHMRHLEACGQPFHANPKALAAAQIMAAGAALRAESPAPARKGRLWSGDAAKIRNRMRAAANRNTTRKPGDSDLARAAYGRRLVFPATFTEYYSSDLKPVAAYAAALGVSFEEAADKVAAHERHLAACGQPFGK